MQKILALWRHGHRWGTGKTQVGATLCALSLGLCMATHAFAVDALNAPLVLAGSGGNLALTRVLAEAYGKVQPGVTIEVPASIGSTGAIRAAVDGAVSLGLISRPLKPEERTWGLTVVPYAQAIVALGAHPTVADTNITFEDLVRIYDKTKTQWQDGHDIVVLTREQGESALLTLAEVIPGFQRAYEGSQQAKRWTTLYTAQEMHRVLAKTPYALGFADFGAITIEQLPIKVLRVNGITPTEEAVRQGHYPLVRTLSFVFKHDKLTPAAQAFLDFARSAAGQTVIQANGYLSSK